MTRSKSADVVVVGSGICGIFVALELVRAGREVTVIERGGMKSHTQQLADRSYQLDLASAKHNHESHPDGDSYPWDYVYGVGGASLHWGGVVERFLPSDFELRSRFGIGRDWPFGYEELAPYYEAAERQLNVAGGPNRFFPGGTRYPLPPHPLSPVDRLVGPLLEPYFHLPQARPTRSVGGRPACCGSAVCGLCPVDARYSVLHTLADEKLLERPELTLLERTVAARLRREGRRIASLELVSADGERSRLRAGTVVLAANGIENASILLRSGLDGPDVGHWLQDHEHRSVKVELRRSARHGYGNSLLTGISYAWRDGDWRAKRTAVAVSPFNPGLQVPELLAREIARGLDGSKAHARARRLFDRTLVLDTLSEDLPRRDRRVELSPEKDGFGLPRNRIRYPPDSDYVARGLRVLEREVAERLRPLGVRKARVTPGGKGGHQLGTCYMGEREGVVDPQQRHHRLENLYVAGGSAFPTYTPHHPTLTIAALAVRLGRHLAKQT